MKTDEKLIDAGAQSIGGVMYLDRVEVGRYTADGFALTADGAKALASMEEVKPKKTTEGKKVPEPKTDPAPDAQK